MTLKYRHLIGGYVAPPIPEYEVEPPVTITATVEPIILLANLELNRIAVANVNTSTPFPETNPSNLGKGISVFTYDPLNSSLTRIQKPSTTSSPLNASATMTISNLISDNRWISMAQSSYDPNSGFRTVALKIKNDGTVQKIHVDDNNSGSEWYNLFSGVSLSTANNTTNYYLELFKVGKWKAITPTEYSILGNCGFNYTTLDFGPRSGLRYATEKILSYPDTGTYTNVSIAADSIFNVAFSLGGTGASDQTLYLKDMPGRLIVANVKPIEDYSYLNIVLDVDNSKLVACSFYYINGQVHKIESTYLDLNSSLSSYFGYPITTTTNIRICTLDRDKRTFVILDSSISGAVVYRLINSTIVRISNIIPISDINVFTRMCEIGDGLRFLVFTKVNGSYSGSLTVYKYNGTVSNSPWSIGDIFSLRTGVWLSSERYYDLFHVAGQPNSDITGIFENSTNYAENGTYVNYMYNRSFLPTLLGPRSISDGWPAINPDAGGSVGRANGIPAALSPYTNSYSVRPNWYQINFGTTGYLEQLENSNGSRMSSNGPSFNNERDAVFRDKGFEVHAALELYYKDAVSIRHCIFSSASVGNNGWEFGFEQIDSNSGKLYMKIRSGNLGYFYSNTINFLNSSTTISGTRNLYGMNIYYDINDDITYIKFYLNGILLTTVSIPTNIMDGSSDSLELLATTNGAATQYCINCIKGKIYEVIGIYGPVLLSDTERLNLNNYCQNRMNH